MGRTIVSIGLLGNKIGMTQIFDESGNIIPVTILKVGPCIITQIKTEVKDGYNAIQVGYSNTSNKSLTQSELGHLHKSNIQPLKYLKEFRVDTVDEFEVGQVLNVDLLSINQLVNIKGKTIGKGFSGLQKRYNFSRGPMTHGPKNHRAPGSIGMGTTPGRVLPGKKMAGQLGNKVTTIQKFIKYTQVDITGKQLSSEQELKLNVLDESGNYLIHKDFVRHLNAKRQRTAGTKTRSEVRGGGRKPWQQKGTGRARAGSNRSPLWKGGGVIFGPKPRTISLKLNKKERRLALQTLLYNKKKNILIIKDLENESLETKTKSFLKICKNCNISLNQKVLVIVSKKTISLKLSTQNIKNVELILASNLNTFSLLKAKQIILTPLAINNIKEIYCD